MSTPVLTVITPTLSNLPSLWRCLTDVEGQTLAGIEHLVVSDGPDPHAESMCRHAGVHYLGLDRRKADGGRSALDAGLRLASAPYLVFWYPGNHYPPEAAHLLWSTAAGHDLGVVRIDYWSARQGRMIQLPAAWDGTFRAGNIDAANCCVRRAFLERSGLLPSQVAPHAVDADGVLWVRLQEAGATIRVADQVALTYVPRMQDTLSPRRSLARQQPLAKV